MNIYIEEVIIENFLVNFIVIISVYIFTKNKIKIIPIIISSVFLSIISLINVVNDFNKIILNILSINIIIYFLFRDDKFIKYIKKVLYLYMIYIEFIGITIFISLLFNINLNNIIVRCGIYGLVAINILFINNYMWKLWKNKLIKDSLKYIVKLNEYNISFDLMLDTGNLITDPCCLNEVIIISEKAYLKKINSSKKQLLKSNIEQIEIDIKTVTGKSKLKGGVYKDITIIKNSKEHYHFNSIIILFVKDNIYNNKFDGIIGYHTYLNKLGGVNL